MWEHAKEFIAIPGALKACLDIAKFIKAERPATKAAGEEIDLRLNSIMQGLRDFARDAMELEAVKYVHSLTNDIPNDLQLTFRLHLTSKMEAAQHFRESRTNMESEWRSVGRANRPRARLERLRDTSRPWLRHLPPLPDDLTSRLALARTEANQCKILGSQPQNWAEWHDVLMGLFDAIPRAIDIDDFITTRLLVGHLAELNVALNNWANWKIEYGIEEFNDVMEKIRSELGAAA